MWSLYDLAHVLMAMVDLGEQAGEHMVHQKKTQFLFLWLIGSLLTGILEVFSMGVFVPQR